MILVTLRTGPNQLIRKIGGLAGVGFYSNVEPMPEVVGFYQLRFSDRVSYLSMWMLTLISLVR